MAPTRVDVESFREQLDRLRIMAEDDGETWDLSAHDQTAITAVLRCHEELVAALKAITDRYEALVDCGDCGFWNPRDEPQVIAARAALAKADAR